MCNLGVAVIALLLFPLTVIAASNHLVSLPLGNIQGVLCPSDASVTQFLGIPYAHPMLGSLRFRPPQLYSVPYPTPALLATTLPSPCGSICRQRWDAVDMTMSSENCLFLNIYVPQEARPRVERGLVPVRVYIHGGVQNRCSASDPHQNGCYSTAATGSIQVNIQFRTGAMGLLAHPATWAESNTTGNWALMDQQLALQWVQENIVSFGGDPSQVLLFGNSAGGQAVNFHIVAPASAGLFTAAVAESPPCTQFVTLQQAYQVGEKLMNATGCSGGDPEGQLACLRSLPWSLLITATDIAAEEYRGITMCEGADWQPPFHPCIDGTVIRAPLLQSLESGEFHRVPYMGGLNHDEGREYVQAFFQPQNLTEGVVAAFLEEIYPGADPKPVLQVYQEGNDVDDPESEFKSMSAMWTDIFFACPARKVLTARQKHEAPTYTYLFDITPSCPQDEVQLGASHTAELFFVFGITENLPPPIGGCDFTPAEVKVSEMMMSAWTSMASKGYPIMANGTAWEQWSEERQMGAVITIEGISMHAVDHAVKCNALDHARKSSAAMYPKGYEDGMSLEEVVQRVGVRMAKRRGEKLVGIA